MKEANICLEFILYNRKRKFFTTQCSIPHASLVLTKFYTTNSHAYKFHKITSYWRLALFSLWEPRKSGAASEIALFLERTATFLYQSFDFWHYKETGLESFMITTFLNFYGYYLWRIIIVWLPLASFCKINIVPPFSIWIFLNENRH